MAIENGSKEQLESKFAALKKEIRDIKKAKKDTKVLVIVYYTGHGYSVAGQLVVACPTKRG